MAEVLSTPPEVARERASRPAAIEGSGTRSHRTELPSMNRDAARKRIPETVQKAYCICRDGFG